MSRYPELAEADLTPAQSRVHRSIANGPRGRVVGPLRVWLHSPEMADRAQALGQYVRYDSVLDDRLTELAILVTARIWSSGFEWAHHAPLAVKAGIGTEVVDAISLGHCPDLEDPAMRAVFAAAVELHRDRCMTDATHAAAMDCLGLQGMIDLVAICGYYTLISMTINTFDVPRGEGPVLPALEIGPTEYFRV